MKILIIEPFFSGSHRQWAEGLQLHSRHDIDLITLPGRHWKWRMHGAAVTLAGKFLENKQKYDVILVSDMIDLSCFLSLARKELGSTKIGVYFHENQLTYPWSPNDEDIELKRDRHYAFINYTSALSADFCWFNSEYHLTSFIDTLPNYLRAYPDHCNLQTIEIIKAKSKVMSLGMDLERLLSFSRTKEEYQRPVLLWNHRWEYDKNPEEFFQCCRSLSAENVDFKIIVCGERNKKYPKVFDHFKNELKPHILHWGYVNNKKEYYELLSQANLLLVTSNQDFFGGSTVEAIAAGCFPFLPNRLAYPQHIPNDLRQYYLYDKVENSVDQIARNEELFEFSHLNKLRDHVSKYDWKSLIQEYNWAFEHIVSV